MIKTIRIFVLSIVLISGVQTAEAQDVHFSQYDKMPLIMNPSQAGMGKGYNRASLIYRTQYTTVGNTYSSPGLSIDFPILAEKMRIRNGILGVGLHVMQDVSGYTKLKHFNTGLSLSGIIKLNKQSRLSAGIQGSLSLKSYDPGAVEWGSQYDGFSYDGSLPSNELFLLESTTFFNTSAGVSYKFFNSETNVYGIERNSFDCGIGIHNFNRRPQNFYTAYPDYLHIRLTAHAKGLIALDNYQFGFTPNILYQRQAARNELVFGSGFNYYLKSDTKYTGFIKQMYLGFDLQYRLNDAVITGVRMKFNDFEVGISYDFTTSDLGPYVNRIGGFEISLKFIDTYGTLFNQGNKHVINSSGGNLNL